MNQLIYKIFQQKYNPYHKKNKNNLIINFNKIKYHKKKYQVRRH